MKEPLSAMAELDETFRALLENGILRLKQCKHGPMMFFAGDTHIGRSLDLYGELSEPEIELFRRYLRPGMVAVDVGANIGTHTVCFAQSVGPSGRDRKSVV